MMERLNYAQRDGLIRDLQFAYGEAKARLGGASLSIYSDVEEQIEAIREQRALVPAALAVKSKRPTGHRAELTIRS